MKYHIQKILKNPGWPKTGLNGSCYPTVIACLLDKEIIEVPHFNVLYWSEEEKDNIRKALKKIHGGDQEKVEKGENKYIKWLWYRVFEGYLMSQGKREVEIENHEEWLENNQDKPYIAVGPSSRGVDHVVIYMNGVLFHDPHPSSEGLLKVNNYTELVDIDEL